LPDGLTILANAQFVAEAAFSTAPFFALTTTLTCAPALRAWRTVQTVKVCWTVRAGSVAVDVGQRLCNAGPRRQMQDRWQLILAEKCADSSSGAFWYASLYSY